MYLQWESGEILNPNVVLYFNKENNTREKQQPQFGSAQTV